MAPFAADQPDQAQVHGADLHAAAAHDDVRELLLQDAQNALDAIVRTRQLQGVADALRIGALVYRHVWGVHPPIARQARAHLIIGLHDLPVLVMLPKQRRQRGRVQTSYA